MASNSDDDDFTLPSRYRKVHLEALRVSARRKMSLYLNIERLPNENGIVTDYNGLAEKIGFSFLEIQNFGRQNVKDPTSEVLNAWTSRPDLTPTVGKLFQYLEEMGRIDILTDCKQIILSDIEHYVSMQERRQDDVVPLQDNTISQSETPQDYTDHHVDEYRYMTVQDVENNSQTFYDAFVCYDPDGYDLQFVKKMLKELESPKFGLKLFVPWRDDLPGSSTHTVSAKLIQDRCRRMVIIMSPRFLKSPSCDFQTKFAHSLSPGSRSKKLVPVLITPCPIPQILRHVTLCDFTKRDLMEWFWVRLARAIKAPLNFEELQISKSVCLDDITLNLDPEQYRSASSSSGSGSSSSQPLPIIHASTSSSNSSSSHNSPVSSMDHSPMEHSPSSMSSLQSTSSLHSVSSSLTQTSSPVPPARRHRHSEKIPQLFPSSQC